MTRLHEFCPCEACRGVQTYERNQSVRIPIAEPALIGNEKKYVIDCINRNELSWSGPYVQKFEEQFADFCQTKFAVTCSSGTAALHLALLALGIGPRDDVYLPDLTYVATANAVRYVGANPIFCEIDERTWCIDPLDVRSKMMRSISRKRNPAVIIPVHLYGMPADMPEFDKLVDEFGVYIVEDAAEAHGATIQGKRVGSFGDMGIFSFYGNKILTMGEGGVITTNDPTLHEKLIFYRGQAVDHTRRYFHSAIGYNYRLTNIQAAIGLAQLEQYEKHAIHRSKVVGKYQRLLDDWDYQMTCSGVIPADWLFTILIPKNVSRDEIARALSSVGIETRPAFIPMTRLPMYAGITPPIVADISNRGLNLPTFYSMKIKEVELVVSNLKKFVEEQKNASRSA